VKPDYFHWFFDMVLCVRLYVEAGPEFFPRMFLPVKRFYRDPEPHALGYKAYATQIGWLKYSR